MEHKIIGNLYNKYESCNPVEKYLMSRFISVFTNLYGRVNPESVLDVGCGEGYLTEIIQKINPDSLLIGADIDADFLLRETSCRVKRMVAFRLPDACFHEESFDLVILSEVLEHIHHPHEALKVAGSLAKYGIIITVPHEPFWRICNMFRLKYIRRLGDTPGHIQHFSYKGFGKTLGQHFQYVHLRSCFPWLMALCLKGNI